MSYRDNKPPSAGDCLQTMEQNGTTYGLHLDTDEGLVLWTLGEHGYCAGHVMNESGFSAAVDAAEEELAAEMADFADVLNNQEGS